MTSGQERERFYSYDPGYISLGSQMLSLYQVSLEPAKSVTLAKKSL